MQRHSNEECEKVSIVSSAYAIIDPGAVMVEVLEKEVQSGKMHTNLDTFVASRAMS